jgi:dipeptidyl aminopeptidase/acylaminoacyl peptidase
VLTECGAPIDSVAYSPDGTRLVAGSRDGRVLLCETATGKEVARVKVGGRNRDAKAAFSPDGKLVAAGSRDGELVLWDAGALREVRRFPRSKEGVMCLAFSPDGKRLAVGCISERKGRSSDLVRLWDAGGSREVRRFVSAPELMITTVAFSPDGRLLAAGDWGKTIHLWDAATGRLVRRIDAKGSTANRLAFSPDGRMLASMGHDATVRLWEVITGEERRWYKGHFGLGTALAFAPDGLAVATGSMDTTVLLWGVRGPGAKSELSSRELAARWEALGGSDAPKAYDAILALAAAPAAAVPLFRMHVRHAAGQGKTIERLLADLDSDEFARREKATAELAKLGEAAAAALRKVLEGKPSLEVRRRADAILRKLLGQALSPEQVRQLRAVEALEHAGTPEARRLLEVLSRGAVEAPLTRAAKAALGRLVRRDGGRND